VVNSDAKVDGKRVAICDLPLCHILQLTYRLPLQVVTFSSYYIRASIGHLGCLLPIFQRVGGSCLFTDYFVMRHLQKVTVVFFC